MKTPKIDQLFADKLAKHQIKPSPQAWDTINEALNKRKRKRMLIWQMAAGIALCTGVASLMYFGQQKETENKNLVQNSNKIVPKISQNTTNAISKVVEIAPNNSSVAIKIKKEKEKESYLFSENKQKNSTNNKIQVLENQVNNTKVNANEIANTQNKETVTDVANTTVLVTKNLQTTEPTTKVDSIATNKEEDVIQVIVKLQAETTPTENMTVENKAKKRTFLGKIWNKVRDGDAITLQDVGIKTEKLPKFLRRNE
jgi:hypothetical protein